MDAVYRIPTTPALRVYSRSALLASRWAHAMNIACGPHSILGQAFLTLHLRPGPALSNCLRRFPYSCCTPLLNGGTLVCTGWMEGSVPSGILFSLAPVCPSAENSPGWL